MVKNYPLIYIIPIVILFSCAQKNSNNKNIILAQVGNKAITLQEFVRRSEYTIRPPYCRNNNYIHKKIILNSLVGEKLLALEAGEDNELSRNTNYQAYLEGRKEQAMRQVHYYEEAYKKIQLTREEINNEYKMAGRRYTVSYFSISDETIASQISMQFNNKNIRFEEMYYSISGDTIVPRREIHWQDPENPQIHNTLFKERPEKDKIIGPIQTEDGKFIFMSVTGWIDGVIISENEALERKKSVMEKLTNEKAWSAYKHYVSQLMRNKQLQFYKETFEKLVNIAAPIYIKSENEKEKLFNNSFWKGKSSEEIISEFPKNLDEINHLPLFSVDGKIWNVEGFRAHLRRHPLVFRKEDIRIKNFAEQFKLAVVDMIRDYYITQDAYKKGYDKSEMVKQNVTMWQDNMTALYQKHHYLKSINSHDKDQLKVVNDYLTPYIDSLQTKYNDIIEINIAEFEKIKLTRVDMLVIQPDQPFPVVVPNFPLITSDSRLDYGKIMKTSTHL